MAPDRIAELIVDALRAFYEENDLEGEVTAQTRLFGGSAQLDSIQLVTFIVEVEQALADALDTELTLADERAMSRERSPFLSVATLTEYVIERVSE